MKQRTDTYIATFAPGDPGIDSLRGFMKKCNIMLKESGRAERYYIKLRARGHRQGVQRYQQELPLRFAERLDAYMYQRNPSGV